MFVVLLGRTKALATRLQPSPNPPHRVQDALEGLVLLGVLVTIFVSNANPALLFLSCIWAASGCGDGGTTLDLAVQHFYDFADEEL